jgi:hypothetical protein
MSRRILALGVAALALVGLALVRGAGGGPPLYDGLCLPPQYKTLGSNPPPPTASMVYTTDLLATTQELADNPSAPQAQIIIGAGTLAPAPGASTVTVTITPVKPPATHPDGSIDGNVYDFEAAAGGKPVQPAPSHPVTIVLGATASGGPTLTVEHFDGSRWTALKTFQSGCGSTYDAASPTLGLFVLVAQGGSASSPGAGGGSSTGSSGPSALVFIVGALVVLAVVIAAVRAGRRRR